MKHDGFKTFAAVTVSIAIIALVLIILTSCAATRIAGGQRAKLLSAERPGYSSDYIVCLQLQDGRVKSFRYNVHCYPPCVAAIPAVWDVTEFANGSLAASPVK